MCGPEKGGWFKVPAYRKSPAVMEPEQAFPGMGNIPDEGT